MNAHLAVVDILVNDATYGPLVGSSGSRRVFYDEAEQTAQMPFAVVHEDSVEPTDDKDGVSTLDHDFVYVIHFGSSMNQTADMAQKGRNALDRKAAGTYNGVQIQSVQFLTQRTGSELLVDKRVRTIEQLYKIITIQ